MNEITISDVRLTAMGATDHARGLVGFLRMTVNDSLILDSVTLRRTLAGEWALGFPVRTDTHGRVHALVRPTDDAARRLITAQVVAALGLEATATDDRRVQAEPGR